MAPPGSDPAEAPLVCVQFNATWLPYIVGALMQLVQPAAWATSDPTVLQTTLEAATELISNFGTAEDCTMLTFRFTVDCILQFSLDGGTTWEDVSGWPTYAPGCYTGPEGPAGPTGPAGGYTPGTPTFPPGLTTEQEACNVAAYLTDLVIKGAVNQAVSGYHASETVYNTIVAIAGLFDWVAPVIDLILAGGDILVNLVTSRTISEYDNALADATYWAAVQCAIYNAIVADGEVDSSNFSAMVAAVGAVSSSYPDVTSSLVSYLNGMGLNGVLTAQLQGAYYVGDCGACVTGSWCFHWDFTAAPGAWAAFGGTAATWVSGQGWQSIDEGGAGAFRLFYDFGAADITAIDISWKADAAASGATRTVDYYVGGVYNSTTPLDAAAHPGGTTQHITSGIPAGVNEIDIYLSTNGSAPNTTTLYSLTIFGSGACPFGTPNC